MVARRPCSVVATTEAPAATSADTVVVGAARGRGRSPTTRPTARCRRSSTPARPAPTPRHLAVTHAGGQAVGPGRARPARRTSTASAPAPWPPPPSAGRRDLGARTPVLGGPAPRRRRRRDRRSSRGRCSPPIASRATAPGPTATRRRARASSCSATTTTARPRSRAPRSWPRPSTAPATCRTRPPNDLPPAALGERARAIAAEAPHLSAEVGGARGAAPARDGRLPGGRAGQRGRAARSSSLRYEHPEAGPDAPLLGLVGKAVTFDSGGLSIKPAGVHARA